MSDPSALEMIAELQQAQSESIQDDLSESEISADNHLNGLDLEPITNEEIECTVNQIELEPIRNVELAIIQNKFNADGYNKILRAMEEGKLVEFASVLPPPKERSKILTPDARVNNSDTWARYIY